jgi:hypothetical protein
MYEVYHHLDSAPDGLLHRVCSSYIMELYLTRAICRHFSLRNAYRTSISSYCSGVYSGVAMSSIAISVLIKYEYRLICPRTS